MRDACLVNPSLSQKPWSRGQHCAAAKSCPENRCVRAMFDVGIATDERLGFSSRTLGAMTDIKDAIGGGLMLQEPKIRGN